MKILALGFSFLVLGLLSDPQLRGPKRGGD